MYNYKVEFSRESLQRDPEGPARLLRDVRRIVGAARMIQAFPARYREVRGVDGSTAIWFDFPSPDVDRALVTLDLLKPYAWTPVERPAWPDSEWRQLDA
jgi:hypothetical protein